MSSRRLTNNIMAIGLSIVLVNLLFFLLHYFSLLVPVELIKSRVVQGFKAQNLVEEDYPRTRFGWSANYTQIGLDQYTECAFILTAMYRGETRWKTAIAPKVAMPHAPSKTYCESARILAEGHSTIDENKSFYVLRYWRGGKVFLSFLLQYFNFFQINNLIKTLNYFSYFLIGFLLFSVKRTLFVPFFPVIALGVFFSGINYHGGISNSLPYLFALWSVIGLLYLHKIRKPKLHPVFFVISGSVASFVYSMTGALMLSVSLLFLILYFVVLSDRTEWERYKWIGLYLGLFFLGFFSSILIKQLVSLTIFSWEAVIGNFVEHLLIRMETHHSQVGYVSATAIIQRQFGEFVLATYDSYWLRDLLIYLGVMMWGAAISLAGWHYYNKRCITITHEVLALLIASFLVLIRFVLFRNHSLIHGPIVSRYAFLPLAFGWVACLLSVRHLLSAQPAYCFTKLQRSSCQVIESFRKKRED